MPKNIRCVLLGVIAWTLADLDGEDRPGAEQVGAALAFREGVAA